MVLKYLLVMGIGFLLVMRIKNLLVMKIKYLLVMEPKYLLGAKCTCFHCLVVDLVVCYFTLVQDAHRQKVMANY
jgi:hypothetical protein